MSTQFTPSSGTIQKIDAFTDADINLKKVISDFEAGHMAELQYIEQLREERNAKLDEATRELRAEAEWVPYTVTKRLSYGPFVSQRRITNFYILERFLAIARQYGLYPLLLSLGVLKEEVVMPMRFEEAHNILEDQRIAHLFEECEDVRDSGAPAITRPGSMVSFGTETKER